MSEFGGFKPNDRNKAGPFDYATLAEVSERQGKEEEAKAYRLLAQRQPGLQKERIEKINAHQDEVLAKEKESQPNLVPLSPGERNDARRMEGLQAEVKKILDQGQPPISQEQPTQPQTSTQDGSSGGQ
ncbi:MAG TPA: hypothetical protein VLF89_05745 [Candidatus Saccharimonadales bacterium]|nr:hypothetical protein [Candidatus Saccharimonadales bacterium]